MITAMAWLFSTATQVLQHIRHLRRPGASRDILALVSLKSSVMIGKGRLTVSSPNILVYGVEQKSCLAFGRLSQLVGNEQGQ